MMLNYRLKFKKLPRPLKKYKDLKTGTEYTLYEADKLYQKALQSVDDKSSLSKEKITFEIISLEDGDIMAFKLPAYNREAPSLQDAVAFDFSQSKMKLGDDPEEKKILERTLEMEESMMSEFNQSEPEQQESVVSDEINEQDEALLRQKQEEEQAYLKQLEQSENKTDNEPEIQEDIQENFQEEVIEEPIESEEKIEPEPLPTRQSRHSTMKEESLLDKQTFVSIDNPDIKKKTQSLEHQLLETQEKGVSFILSHLTYSPSDNAFIRKAKKDFVTENYSDEPFITRTRIHQQRINEMYRASSDTLQQFYEQEVNKGYEHILEKDRQTLIQGITNEYNVKAPALKEEKEKQYQLALEAMENRHQQEKETLNQKQLSEKQNLKSECQSNLQEEKQSLEQSLNDRYTVDWASIQVNDKNDWVRKTNDNLTIGKENIEGQMIDQMNQFEMEDEAFYQSLIQTWQEKVDDKQQDFQQSYQQHEAEQQSKAEQERIEEEAKRAERQLALEENKVAVQKETLNQQLKQKDYEIQRLKDELEKKDDDYHQAQVEAKQRENELMRTITESHQVTQALNQDKHTKQEVYSKAQVRKWVAGGVAGTMLAIGMIGFGVKTHYDHVEEAEAQEQVQQAQEKKQTQLEKALKENQSALKDVQSEKDKLSKQQKETQKALDEANKKLKDTEKKNNKKNDKKSDKKKASKK